MVSRVQAYHPERRWLPKYLTIGLVSLPYVPRDRAIATIRRSFVDQVQICVAFCNSHTMLHAFRSKSYAETLSKFLLLNDGIGVDLCSFLFEGAPFAENLNGTDFVPDLLLSSGAGRTVYLLGAKPEWIEKSAKGLAQRFPNCRIVGFQHGYFTREETDRVIAQINAVSPDILLVGLGNPLQEEFIAQYAARINARVLIGVGAFLDFMAGRVPRAPKIIRRLRLEWLFRLAKEPMRLGRRYTVELFLFIALILRYRIKPVRGEDPGLAPKPGEMRRLRPEPQRKAA